MATTDVLENGGIMISALIDPGSFSRNTSRQPGILVVDNEEMIRTLLDLQRYIGLARIP